MTPWKSNCYSFEGWPRTLEMKSFEKWSHQHVGLTNLVLSLSNGLQNNCLEVWSLRIPPFFAAKSEHHLVFDPSRPKSGRTPSATPCQSWSALPKKWPREKWRWTAKVNFPVHVSSLFISSGAPPPPNTHVRFLTPPTHTWVVEQILHTESISDWEGRLPAFTPSCGRGAKKGFFLRRGGAIFSGIDSEINPDCGYLRRLARCSAHVSAPEKGRFEPKCVF